MKCNMELNGNKRAPFRSFYSIYAAKVYWSFFFLFSSFLCERALDYMYLVIKQSNAAVLMEREKRILFYSIYSSVSYFISGFNPE